MTNGTHYFGDSCPGGHRIDELKARIAELTKSAEVNYAKARDYEVRADRRYADLKETVFIEHRARAKGGNMASRLIIESPHELKVAVDIRADQDTTWKSLVEDYKFCARKANMDNNMIQTLQGELAQLEREAGK